MCRRASSSAAARASASSLCNSGSRALAAPSSRSTLCPTGGGGINVRSSPAESRCMAIDASVVFASLAASRAQALRTCRLPRAASPPPPSQPSELRMTAACIRSSPASTISERFPHMTSAGIDDPGPEPLCTASYSCSWLSACQSCGPLTAESRPSAPR